jgi:hypothetical protein
LIEQPFVGATPQWRHGVQRHRFDDPERVLAVHTERVEAGEQAFEGEAESGGALGAEDKL